MRRDQNQWPVGGGLQVLDTLDLDVAFDDQPLALRQHRTVQTATGDVSKTAARNAHALLLAQRWKTQA